MNLSDNYLSLITLLKTERATYSKQASQLINRRPWYFYLTKQGLVDFLQNGAPDKTEELFAANAFCNHLQNLSETEIQALKKYSELNVSLQKDASIDAIGYRAFGVFTVTMTGLLFLISVSGHSFIVDLFIAWTKHIKETFPTVFVFAQIFLFPLTLSFILVLISLVARVHYLMNAIEVDRTLEKAILIIKTK